VIVSKLQTITIYSQKTVSTATAALTAKLIFLEKFQVRLGLEPTTYGNTA
jgi:hypothetical protein